MYKFKDILFALKTEYDKNEELLKKLEEHIRLKVSGRIDFSLDKSDEDKVCELYYDISKKNRFLRTVLRGLVSDQMGIVYSSNNDKFSGDTKDFDVDDNEAFREILDRLLSREFNQTAFNTEAESEDEIYRKNVKIFADRIITSRKSATGGITSIYVPKDNIVRFEGDGETCLSYASLYNFMDMEFPKEQFPEYLQGLIESSEVLGKPVVFYDNGSIVYRKAFKPVEEEKRLVLVNKKVKQ